MNKSRAYRAGVYVTADWTMLTNGPKWSSWFLNVPHRFLPCDFICESLRLLILETVNSKEISYRGNFQGTVLFSQKDQYLLIHIVRGVFLYPLRFWCSKTIMHPKNVVLCKRWTKIICKSSQVWLKIRHILRYNVWNAFLLLFSPCKKDDKDAYRF